MSDNRRGGRNGGTGFAKVSPAQSLCQLDRLGCGATDTGADRNRWVRPRPTPDRNSGAKSRGPTGR
eukprot:9051593-Alexandrium_andersonii.AAC.1